jgi:N-acetylmuramoyl-L-alanine amidase
VFIDVGHGGEDTGAAAFGYIEAEENLTVSLYMKKLLEEQGLTVRLSREEMNIAGGEDAENNPYLSQARIDALYSCHASYLISNHLNGGSGRQSGWQIYSSVRADTAWAEKIAARWQELGWHHNNSNHGLVKNGIYQRWARDNAHSGRDYYFILRETGGLATGSSRYRVHHDHMASQLRRGAEGILLEYLFLDNRHDMDYWRENYRLLAEAAVAGCYDYWQLEL